MQPAARTLDIRHLTVSYRTPGGSVAALSDVTLGIDRGRTLAVVGESGSGKSTVALAVMGLLPSEARIVGGTMTFDGTDLVALDAEQRRRLRGRRMALVFQDPFAVLNPSLRVGEQIGEGLVHHRGLSREAAGARAIELLAEVGIGEAKAVAAAYPHELSGGMRQRALIAGALAAEPDLLILDEPTTALDVTVEAQILDLLEGLKAGRGLSMLFITHNLGVVRRVADEVAVLYAGEIVEQGSADDIFASQRHPYTKGLFAAIPTLARRQDRLASIPGRLPDMRRPPPGCRFEARCPFAGAGCDRPQAMATAGRQQVRCHRAAELAHAAWDETPSPRDALRITGRGQGEGQPLGAAAAARPRPQPDPLPPRKSTGGDPVVAAAGLCKTFILTRGLAALAFDGWRPVLRPVRVPAVDQVSLEIAPGEVVGLVGESGSGKTTLGRTVLRLIDADSGRLRIAGEDVTATPQSRLAGMRRQAQIVFQNPDSSLNPRKTVGELIARPLVRFAMCPPGEVAARVSRLLDLVRLPAYYADRYPHQMSGGEKQRVGIARALASEPRFIVCDEPVSALDVSVQAAIVNLLAELRDRLGVAYLLISHDISVVAHLADRIAVMYRGRIVEIGPTAAVLAPPHHPYTEALLSAVPSLDATAGERIRLPLEPRRSAQATGCVFAGRCPRRIGVICDNVPPAALAVAPSHLVSCHLYDERARSK